jgi:hypothetical protein
VRTIRFNGSGRKAGRRRGPEISKEEPKWRNQSRSRFPQKFRENPDATLAIAKDRESIVCVMSESAFAGLLDRMRKEGGSLAEWLVSNDDFVTNIDISDLPEKGTG